MTSLNGSRFFCSCKVSCKESITKKHFIGANSHRVSHEKLPSFKLEYLLTWSSLPREVTRIYLV